jgi:hypothetical protein
MAWRDIKLTYQIQILIANSERCMNCNKFIVSILLFVLDNEIKISNKKWI